MDLDKRQDVVKTTYDKLHRQIGADLESDEFYQYFYNLLETGMNYCQFTNVRLQKEVDEDWIAAIEAAIPALHQCVMNPRKFIEEEREVVNIAMARNITTESIRHLTQHADLIDKYDETDGTVIPNRILNVFKEESLNIYENRFICTLVGELQHFVNKRYNVIFENSKNELGSFFELESRIDNYTETVDYKIKVNIRDKQTDVDNERENQDIFARLDKIHRHVNGLASTDFISEMRKYPAVRHPIVKTNVIAKNANYKKCHELWNFIYSYDKVGYKVNLLRQEPVISREFERDIFNSLMWNYTMIHNQVEDPRQIDINHPKREKTVDIKYIRQVLDEIVQGSDIPDANLKKIVLNELTSLQMKNKKQNTAKEKLKKRKRFKNNS